MYRYKKFKPVPFPGGNGDWNEYSKREKAEFDRVNDHAKANNTRVGRTFKIPCADSYAYYQVVGATKHTYRYQNLDVGDAWTDRILGYQGTINKEKIDELIDHEERIRQMFAQAGK